MYVRISKRLAVQDVSLKTFLELEFQEKTSTKLDLNLSIYKIEATNEHQEKITTEHLAQAPAFPSKSRFIFDVSDISNDFIEHDELADSCFAFLGKCHHIFNFSEELQVEQLAAELLRLDKIQPRIQIIKKSTILETARKCQTECPEEWECVIAKAKNLAKPFDIRKEFKLP